MTSASASVFGLLARLLSPTQEKCGQLYNGNGQFNSVVRINVHGEAPIFVMGGLGWVSSPSRATYIYPLIVMANGLISNAKCAAQVEAT